MSRFLHFEFGGAGPLHVRTERVPLGLPRPLRLLYASDLHLGHRWTARVPDRLLEATEATRPNLILLGGDLADRTAALPRLGRLVSQLGALAPVHAVPGNHDEWLGVERVREAVRSAGGHWLPDEPIIGPVRIDGTITPTTETVAAPSGWPGQSPRCPGVEPTGASRTLPRPPEPAVVVGPRVLCGHDPADFPAAVAAGYDLVLAGHLHGGQCVWWNRNGSQYPAAWFNRWHGLRFEEGRSVMLVSRGAADTFPFRFNCPREVILCVLT